jgi:hypothetical protein
MNITISKSTQTDDNKQSIELPSDFKMGEIISTTTGSVLPNTLTKTTKVAAYESNIEHLTSTTVDTLVGAANRNNKYNC